MPARDALHYQLIFTESLAPGGIQGALMDGFEKSQRGMLEPGPRTIEAIPNPIGVFAPRHPYRPDGLREYFERHMRMALPFYVDPRMTALVTAAAESLPADEVLRPEDLPATHGFLYLPHGLSEIDLRGQMMVHNVVVWFQTAGGVDLWFLSNKFDERDMVNLRHQRMFGEDGLREMPELTLAHYTRFDFGATVPVGLGGTKVLPPEISEQLRVIHDEKTNSYAWSWPEGYDMNEWLGETMEIAPAPTITWLLAMWKLMQQTIVDVRTEGVDRQLRRAAERRQMRQTDVTVIALRKRKRTEAEGPEQEIEWSHRWLRRGHWRRVWVGPRDGEIGVDRYQTPVYIHPTIVNAHREDLPLLVRDHVYSLER